MPVWPMQMRSFTGGSTILFNHLFWGSLRSIICNFIPKSIPVQIFSCEFCDFFQNSFFAEYYWVTGPINANEINIYFQLIFHFYTPWKHQKHHGFYDVFRGYRKRPVAWNELSPFLLIYKYSTLNSQKCKFIVQNSHFPRSKKQWLILDQINP